jgi:hypothetical protein
MASFGSEIRWVTQELNNVRSRSTTIDTACESSLEAAQDHTSGRQSLVLSCITFARIAASGSRPIARSND